METTLSELKIEYKNYLDTLGIGSLRSLGRHVGVSKSTEKKKDDLIDLIIAVLVGELAPVPQTKRGAPVKAEAVSAQILSKLEEIRKNSPNPEYTEEDFIRYNKALDNAFEKRARGEGGNFLSVNAPITPDANLQPAVYVGQVGKVKDFYCLLPLNARERDIRIVLTEEKAQEYGVKEGDVISCQAEESESFLIVTKIFTINEVLLSDFNRKPFDETEICESSEILPLKNCKFIDWFLPIAKGRRALIVSSPKAGKTILLKNIAEELISNGEVKTFGLLIEQAPETVSEYKKIFAPYDLAGTTYEDEPGAHVFAAEFLLKRAKRYTETGKDVVLILDGLQALAKAYDESNCEDGKMLSCGLSVKTLRYIKKFLGSARSLAGGGSLTVICSMSVATGNVEDDLFYSEISSIFGTRIYLNGEYAAKRIFPAVDLERSYSDGVDKLLSPYKNTVDMFIRGEYIPKLGGESLCRLLSAKETIEEFYESAKDALGKI